jgi:dihydropteroate synthase
MTAKAIANQNQEENQKIDLQVIVHGSTQARAAIDQQLSQREIKLDPFGYWIIYLERETQLICAKHFTNTINQQGLAVDPETGNVIPARGKVIRESYKLFQAKTAKQLCIQVFEDPEFNLVSQLDHAAYIGRETQKAEFALLNDTEYIQD